MANVTTLLKYSLKTNIVKSIFFEIISNVSRYYYTFGQVSPWPTTTQLVNNVSEVVSNELIPPAISDSYPAELEVRRNTVYYKNIDANDVAIVVRRVDWGAGIVYDMYDDYTSTRLSYNGAQSIDQALFFVVTDEYNVYKCLYNAGNKSSTEKPVGTSTDPIIMADGYVWKFMYTIPVSLRNKFLTTSYIPVTTALSNQFYSNGSIVSYTVENRGSKYVKNSWSVKRFVIINGGTGYNYGDVTITFPNAPIGGAIAEAAISSIGDNGNIQEITVTAVGSGYDYQPVPTITLAPGATGAGLQYIVEYERDSSAYTELKVTGDGYNEMNPYSLKEISIIDRGVFSSTPTGDLFTFPSPQNRYGRRPIVNVTFREILGSNPTLYEVDTITVQDEGYGYTEPLIFGQNVFAGPLVFDNSGFTCDLNVSTQKNDAVLIPLINSSGEIEAIQIVEPGIGYTYATVQVIGKKTVLMVPNDPLSGNLVDLSNQVGDVGYVQGFIPASVALSFGVGDIETKQSNVELLAVDGAIDIIKVDYAGSGYPSSTKLNVIGDGHGCTAVPIVVDGRITRVDVTNPGAGYTFATIEIDPVQSGLSHAILRPIISPKGGHGKDAVGELYARTVMLVSKLSREENQGIPTTNDYRQISIVKNPKQYQAESFYRKATGSTCALLICDMSEDNRNTYPLLEQDDVLQFSSTKSFTLVEKAEVNNKYHLVVQVNDNFVPTAGSTIYKLTSDNAYNMSITSVVPPEVNKFSGEMLYIDNRVKFTSTLDQTIILSTLISF